jgi:acetyl-CoA carboxylase biotin carboxyl carrier protein
MDLRKLKTLIDLVSESNVSELEITEAEGKVRIVKAQPVAASQTVLLTNPGSPAANGVPPSVPQAGVAPGLAPGLSNTQAMLPLGMPAALASGAFTAAQLGAAAAAEPPPAASGHLVKSPMVGTFYRASSPGGKPFVDVGSEVKEGETLCIIEAMKILNEIESDKAGVVRKILVDNGTAVEYGQPLFEIEPAER